MAFRRAFSINLLPRAILAFVYMCSRGGEYTFLGGYVLAAARDSKLVPRSKKNSPKIDTTF